MKKSAKTERIIDCALQLLKSEGDYGVTMRQVAVKAEMSLSNVQYYFKNKDELLKAMADRYFQQCLEEMKMLPELSSHENLHTELDTLLKGFLCHGLKVSEMCCIFREYWAISTRNSVIEEYLRNYYREMAQVLASKLRSVSSDEDALKRSVTMIIPYVEGYSVTALAMPVGIDDATEMLVNTVKGLLANPDNDER